MQGVPSETISLYVHVCTGVGGCRHRRMRRGAGGAAAPPAFGQRRSFFWAAAMVGGGGVFQFSGGRMTSRGQCLRGGACECPRVGVFFNFPEGE